MIARLIWKNGDLYVEIGALSNDAHAKYVELAESGQHIIGLHRLHDVRGPIKKLSKSTECPWGTMSSVGRGDDFCWMDYTLRPHIFDGEMCFQLKFGRVNIYASRLEQRTLCERGSSYDVVGPGGPMLLFRRQPDSAYCRVNRQPDFEIVEWRKGGASNVETKR